MSEQIPENNFEEGITPEEWKAFHKMFGELLGKVYKHLEDSSDKDAIKKFDAEKIALFQRVQAAGLRKYDYIVYHMSLGGSALPEACPKTDFPGELSFVSLCEKTLNSD